MNGNPVFNQLTEARDMSNSMTFAGVAMKTLMLLAVTIAGAFYTYSSLEVTSGLIIGGSVLGLVLALVVIFKPTTAPYLSPVYAICEGVALGGLSLLADTKYPGIAAEAVLTTSSILAVMLMLYAQRIIVVNEKYIFAVMAAMVGLLVLYLSDIILSLFGIHLPVINDASPWGIAFSVGVVILAALSLAIDFKQIEEGVSHRAPKYMEWYCAFGLLVTLVWLYVEVLRLLKKVKEK